MIIFSSFLYIIYYSQLKIVFLPAFIQKPHAEATVFISDNYNNHTP